MRASAWKTPKSFGHLSKEGAEYVRAKATEQLMPGIAVTEGALEVSNVDVGDRLISELQMLGEDFGTEVEGWQIDQRPRATEDRSLFPWHLFSESVPGRRPQIS